LGEEGRRRVVHPQRRIRGGRRSVNRGAAGVHRRDRIRGRRQLHPPCTHQAAQRKGCTYMDCARGLWCGVGAQQYLHAERPRIPRGWSRRLVWF